VTLAGRTLAIPPAQRQALSDWLTHLRALDGAAANTVTAYGSDVGRYLDFLVRHREESMGTKGLTTLPQADSASAGSST
jgi:integrase/recombinase XerC